MKIFGIDLKSFSNQTKGKEGKNGDIKGYTLAEFSEYNPNVIDLINQTKEIVKDKGNLNLFDK